MLLVLVLLSNGWADAARGSGDRLDELFNFAIPAQDLSGALDHYSRVSGMAILIDRELSQGRRSAPVQGLLGARPALEQLLAGSGLMALYTGQDAFTVKPARVTAADGKRSRAYAQGTGDNFASALQVAIEQALCGSSLTRPGQYRAALQLWIGPLGRVQHSRLLVSTGDLRRDAEIAVRLRDLAIGQQPPSSLPQPVTVLVVPDSAGIRMECNP